MKKKLIKDLVIASYVDEKLHEANVTKIASCLSRIELRAYIKALKQEEKKRTVIVTVPNETFVSEKKVIEEIFRNKNIQYISNPDLLLGIRIQDNDTIYDGNLKNSLDNLVNYINEI